MQKTVGTRRFVRTLGVGVLFGSLLLGYGSSASVAESPAKTPSPGVVADETTTDTPAARALTEANQNTADPKRSTTPPASVQPTASKTFAQPYGATKPVTVETDFSRPRKATSGAAGNGDFSLLDDLERLIRGTYVDPRTGRKLPNATIRGNYVRMSISQMPRSHRVGRTLIAAAKAGVKVRVIHGRATQTPQSRSLGRQLNASRMRDARFHICYKGKSNACLSTLNGAIMHSKILVINRTFTRDKKPASGVVWTGSANLGGPSGEQTYNNGMTVYNDLKIYNQLSQMWVDMWGERNISNSYLDYIRRHSSRYGVTSGQAAAYGYTGAKATKGMFYSNLSNVTFYPTPIRASPNNGKDPVQMMLNRVVPDSQCRIRLQQNRFKYRRLAIALKLVELANKGCKVNAVAYEDNVKANRVMHCQQYIRICRPILDVFKSATQRIEVAYAKPHDKTTLVDAVMRPNKLNNQERLPNGKPWPAAGARVTLVQAGSASLTGSNLNVSDEITTESTDPAVFEAYLEHWKAILASNEYRNFPY